MDRASTGQTRNRVTFMRYLTKISEQIICLMSPTQTHNFVWDHQEPSDDGNDDSDWEFGDDDRLFAFEVTKMNEQEENVVSRPGFTMSSKLMLEPSQTSNDMIPPGPMLVSGEVAQGFLSTKVLPPLIRKRPYERTMNDIQLKNLISSSALKIRGDLSKERLMALAKHGLEEKHPQAWRDWLDRSNSITKDIDTRKESMVEEETERLQATESDFGRQFHGYLISLVLEKFPSLDALELSGNAGIAFQDLSELRDTFDTFLITCRQSNINVQALHSFKNGLSKVDCDEFCEQKKRVVCAQIIRREGHDYKHDELIAHIIARGVPNEATEQAKQGNGGILQSVVSLISSPFRSGSMHSVPATPDVKRVKQLVNEQCRRTADVHFLKNLSSYVQDEPLVEPATRAAFRLAHHFFASKISKAIETVMSDCIIARKRLSQAQIGKTLAEESAQAFRKSLDLLVEQIESSQSDSLQTVVLADFHIRTNSLQHTDYLVTGTDEVITPQSFEYKINIMSIPSHEQNNLQLDPSFVPAPSIVEKDSPTFHLSPEHDIVHAQLLGHNRFLLIVNDNRDNFLIYLERPHAIDTAIAGQRTKRTLKQSKIGKDILTAYDESKRMLVLCSSSQVTLHVMVFDETFSNLQSWASPFELGGAWYANMPVRVCHIVFVTGTEEILLVDSNCQGRIFSFVSQRFRPANVSLPQQPISVLSSPDSACALFIYPFQGRLLLTAHHWDSFGATEGITLQLDEIGVNRYFIVTSFVNRQSVHLLFLDQRRGQCRSIALDITKKSSELMFREKGARIAQDTSRKGHYVNNCLIDCFSEVWYRFPVVPAISREAVTESASRRPKQITFISENTHFPFASYFADMIRLFEDEAKKPTGNELQGIQINAHLFQYLLEEAKCAWSDRVSCFRAGQWLADLLCLIPIQIAVTRENCFVPLKNGVTSAEFDNSLLGAELGRIVDSLSLGWYESILNSYMASKPVRVVSSMGEQSVGKSFALNHLVDTSFAGSAMRTTEGVWMSITPTEDALLVSLDFEGVHSIERSPQEDALLVLFNTAISNLVLFRNNFAVSREIANLFQSFQTSSVILDPAANPSLFQSTLIIIIKDVVDSDKREIVREFSSKFQKIVYEEQTANFISRLHAGRLDIIPWPVIESDKFYTYFTALRRRLYSQMITHPSAGEFLHTMKILMAKLKTNDWGAMSQSLASHRAQSLLSILPVALEYGKTAIYPDYEPLKNMDNGDVVEYEDHGHRIFTSISTLDSKDREKLLFELEKTWEHYEHRHQMDEATWVSKLTSYLSDLVDVRISHVETWISANLNRFQTTNASVDTLHRELANATIDLRANAEICRMMCAECHLLCTLSRRHDPLQPHDCHTDHRCPQACDFSEEHTDGQKSCNSRAGHDGPHICHVEDHLCGQPCKNHEKQGCQGGCTQVRITHDHDNALGSSRQIKMAGHSGDHICSARKHACGKPCQLRIFAPDKTIKYSCPGTCSHASDEQHDEHACDNRHCPIACDLCKRLCSNTHLHGLDPSARHLCGEIHHCNALCTSGICEIDTTPQSIEATFIGRHGTFQYTKYTQVAKHLPCVRPIPAGEYEHNGGHTHSLEPSPFHFCDARCLNCGYYCTLPRGHPQQEHETSHGSMSRTRWVIEGSEDSVMEVNGRKFASSDNGAPMMCNLVCQSLNRHAHIDYCRTHDIKPEDCHGLEHQHITARLAPNPDQPKDWISHALYWRRSDPYSREDQANFSKCDVMCPGPEHTATQPAQPSFCTLPLFHAPHKSSQLTGLGWVSKDGHMFSCKNPIILQQAFHVIFVIDRSSSMSSSNRIPMPTTPVTSKISSRHDNRLGAVYLALHAFWDSRQIALTETAASQSSSARRDAYSVVFFNDRVTCSLESDFRQTPDQLLDHILQTRASGGTNFTTAIKETEAVMRRNWSGERSPVVIFLSDGECGISDGVVQSLCRTAIALGKPLSFHTVSFGPHNEVLKRMAENAREIEKSAKRDLFTSAAAHTPSSYAEALDSVRLAETFLGLADSLKKARGALIV
ncbi:hypothetical protein AN958_08742 [Leucoagaricus sp. SymC.cos]|nr:hypothetical protein AN958_08742 [Leucoagaricus sp. SymC.cos]